MFVKKIAKYIDTAIELCYILIYPKGSSWHRKDVIISVRTIHYTAVMDSDVMSEWQDFCYGVP